jgi:hypothetical protein
MRFTKLFLVLMAIVFGLNIAACCGGDKTTVHEKQTIVNQPTVGNQLQDLDEAYKKGSISKEEYDKLRQEIMNKGSSQPK